MGSTQKRNESFISNHNSEFPKVAKETKVEIERVSHSSSCFTILRGPLAGDALQRQGIQESHLRNVITRNQHRHRLYRLRWPLLFFVARAVFGKGAAKVCLKVVPGNFPAVKKREKGNRLQRGREATYSALRWRIFHPPNFPHYQQGKAEYFSCRVIMVRRNYTRKWRFFYTYLSEDLSN